MARSKQQEQATRYCCDCAESNEVKEHWNRVVQSIVEFMNKRWPDVRTMGIDN